MSKEDERLPRQASLVAHRGRGVKRILVSGSNFLCIRARKRHRCTSFSACSSLDSWIRPVRAAIYYVMFYVARALVFLALKFGFDEICTRVCNRVPCEKWCFSKFGRRFCLLIAIRRISGSMRRTKRACLLVYLCIAINMANFSLTECQWNSEFDEFVEKFPFEKDVVYLKSSICENSMALIENWKCLIAYS